MMSHQYTFSKTTKVKKQTFWHIQSVIQTFLIMHHSEVFGTRINNIGAWLSLKSIVLLLLYQMLY